MSAPTYAKVENGIVTDVRVATYDFIVANPDRYGDALLWMEAFQDGSGRGYCAVGWSYDKDLDKFVGLHDADLDEFVTPAVESAPE